MSPKARFAYLTAQIQNVHADLLRFGEKTDKKFAEHDGRFDRLEQKVDKIDAKIDGLARTMPGIVSDAMREVLRKQMKP